MIESFVDTKDQVTTEQFVSMILRGSKGDIKLTCDEWTAGYIDYAFKKDIIEDYDVTNKSTPIERRAAARIVHKTLLIELLEKDEAEWKAAEALLDLYSCHTCVMHIAQVYVKGIMSGREHNLFDVKGIMTRSEVEAIVDRMLDKKKRFPPTENRTPKSIMLQPHEAWEIMRNDHRAMLIDVRTKEEFYQGHINGSISIPLQNIFNNPFSVCTRKDTSIILYCQMGYKSSLAAQALIDAGYRNVYTIPGIDNYPYNSGNESDVK